MCSNIFQEETPLWVNFRKQPPPVSESTTNSSLFGWSLIYVKFDCSRKKSPCITRGVTLILYKTEMRRTMQIISTVKVQTRPSIRYNIIMELAQFRFNIQHGQYWASIKVNLSLRLTLQLSFSLVPFCFILIYFFILLNLIYFPSLFSLYFSCVTTIQRIQFDYCNYSARLVFAILGSFWPDL